MYCRALWVQLTLSPPTAETFTLYTSLLFGRDFCFVYRRHTQLGVVSSLGSFSVLKLRQCQQKQELLPPPNCTDDQDGPRDRMFQIYFGLFLVLLNSLNTRQD